MWRSLDEHQSMRMNGHHHTDETSQRKSEPSRPPPLQTQTKQVQSSTSSTSSAYTTSNPRVSSSSSSSPVKNSKNTQHFMYGNGFRNDTATTAKNNHTTSHNNAKVNGTANYTTSAAFQERHKTEVNVGRQAATSAKTKNSMQNTTTITTPTGPSSSLYTTANSTKAHTSKHEDIHIHNTNRNNRSPTMATVAVGNELQYLQQLEILLSKKRYYEALSRVGGRVFTPGQNSIPELIYRSMHASFIALQQEHETPTGKDKQVWWEMATFLRAAAKLNLNQSFNIIDDDSRCKNINKTTQSDIQGGGPFTSNKKFPNESYGVSNDCVAIPISSPLSSNAPIPQDARPSIHHNHGSGSGDEEQNKQYKVPSNSPTYIHEIDRNIDDNAAAYSSFESCNLHDFLEIVSSGPSATLCDEDFDCLWDLFGQFCRFFLVDDQASNINDFKDEGGSDDSNSGYYSFVFHSYFLELCRGVDYDNSGNSCDDDLVCPKLIKDVKKRLGRAAASYGFVEYLCALLSLNYEVSRDIDGLVSNSNPTGGIDRMNKLIVDSLYINNDDNATSSCQWEMDEVLEMLSFLPMNSNPEIFVGIISFFLLGSKEEMVSTPLLMNRYDLVDKWFEQRVIAISKNANIVKDMGVAFSVCQAGMDLLLCVNGKERNIISSDGKDGDKGKQFSVGKRLRVINEKWRSAIVTGNSALEIGREAPALLTTPSADMDSDLAVKLSEERSRSSELERKVKDLSETCFALEEEMHNEVERLSSEKKKNESNSRKDSSPVAPTNLDTKYLQSPLSDSRDIKEEEWMMEALEQALKLQIEKRILAESQLKEMRLRFGGGTVEETTATTKANEDVMNDLKYNSSDEKFDIEILKDQIKDLVDQVRNNGAQSSTTSIDDQLADFDELLTAFISESDGLDGDDSESTMDRKDVIWFLNELKLRFSPIRESYLKENNGMEMFTTELVLLFEKASIVGKGQQRKTPSSVLLNELKEKDFELSILQGKIVQLKEDMRRCRKTSSAIDNTEQDISKHNEFIAIQEKYKKLENRHRSLVSKMQESISAKDKEISTLKDSISVKDDSIQEQQSLSQEGTTVTRDLKSASFTCRDNEMKSLQNELMKKDERIEKMKIELEQLQASSKDSQNKDSSKVRIRYLEGIIRDLERKLAEAKGTSPNNCRYGSMSFFDMVESPNMTESISDKKEDDTDVDRIKKMEKEIVEVATLLEESERKRVLMQQDFETERSVYASRFKEVQEILREMTSKKG